MKVLVVSGGHANEMQASKIWKYLKAENGNPDVSYEFVPFGETMHGNMNMFLKAMFKNGEIEDRFRGVPREERELMEGIINTVRSDMRNPKKGNAKIVERLYESLDELNPDTKFWKLLPELDNSNKTDVQEGYLKSLLKKTGSDVCIDIHNASGFTCGINPFLFELPKKYKKLNDRLRSSGHINPLSRHFLIDDDFYTIEVPADFVRTGFYRYAIMELVPPDYHAEFHDPRLPTNLKNFEYQKIAVKEIIETIASKS